MFWPGQTSLEYSRNWRRAHLTRCSPPRKQAAEQSLEGVVEPEKKNRTALLPRPERT